MTHTGWRKPTPGLEVAQQHAQVGEQTSVPKSRAFIAVKRVGAHIGLKAGDLLVLDTLAAFSQGQDWDKGNRPIVWASNACLMGQTGFSLSALKRHLRRLAESGVISFRDSPNGKRWGHRDPAGHIVEAYGIDLSPLAARAPEFESLHAEIQTERALHQRLKRQITIARRHIRARLDEAAMDTQQGPWAQLCARFQDLLLHLPKKRTTTEQIEALYRQFRTLQDKIDALFYPPQSDQPGMEKSTDSCGKMSKNSTFPNPKEVISEPHLPTTNQLEPVIRNPQGDLANTTLDARQVMQACPEFTTWATNIGRLPRNWNDLHRLAGQLRPMIGLPEPVWTQAQAALGPRLATIAFAVIFEKHVAGEVQTPAGYLRGILRKAGAGELHLDRSVYGRIAAQAA